MVGVGCGEAGGSGGGELSEAKEGKSKLEGEGDDDCGAEESAGDRKVEETEGVGGEGKDVYEAEDSSDDSGGEEGTAEVGWVGGEGVGFLEGEGGGEDDRGEEVENAVDDEEFRNVTVDAGGENDDNNREEVNGAEGTMDNDDFEETVEEEEAEGGDERNEGELKHVDKDIERG